MEPVHSEDDQNSLMPLSRRSSSRASSARARSNELDSRLSNQSDTSFMLVGPVNVVFDLPDSTTHVETYDVLPAYGKLWATAKKHVGQRKFHLKLDGEELSNRNTSGKIKEVMLNNPHEAPTLVIVVQWDVQWVGSTEVANPRGDNDDELKRSSEQTEDRVEPQSACEGIQHSRENQAHGVGGGHHADARPQDNNHAGGNGSTAGRAAVAGASLVSCIAGFLIGSVMAGRQADRELDTERAKRKQANVEKVDKVQELGREKAKREQADRELETERAEREHANSETVRLTRALENQQAQQKKIYAESRKLSSEKAAIAEDLSRESAARRELEGRYQLKADEAEHLRGRLETYKKKVALDRLDTSLKEYEQVDLLFVVDCTGSMQPHIDGVKNSISRIVDKLRSTYPRLGLHVGFLGYRDLRDKRQFEWKPFTVDVVEFKLFLEGVRAEGGGDQAEDIAGAMMNVTEFSWQRPVRVLFHIADAPCHGRKYHDPVLKVNDDYPDGVDNVHLEASVLRLKQMNINYFFGKINETTDFMIRSLNTHSKINEYIHETSVTDPLDIEKAVVKSVRASIDLASSGGNICPNIDTPVSGIIGGSPDWSSLLTGARHDGRAFKLELQADVEAIVQSNMTFEMSVRPIQYIVQNVAFAEGSCRACFWGACREDGGTSWEHRVFKKFKASLKDLTNKSVNEGLEHWKRCKIELEKSVVAEALSRAFQAEAVGAKSKPIQFVIPEIIEMDDEYYMVEDVLPQHSKFIHYCDNKGYWLQDEFLPQLARFVRWTAWKSCFSMIIADLQGVELEDRILLTDPAVLHVDLNRFGSNNLGADFINKTLDGIDGIELWSRL